MTEVEAIASELQSLVEEATFDPRAVGGRGTWTASTLRSIFRGEMPQFNWQSVALVEPKVCGSRLAQLTKLLEARLADYVVDGKIGNGFANWFGGAMPLPVVKFARRPS